ncbi:MAG: hypothetical protein HPY69_09060 [Armatimonadetes bacterium]|nr:hypothetical protein [Armatimonadota bacterium]
MDISLTDQELELLRRVLSSHLLSLREELRRTEKHNWRVHLREEENTVKALLGRLPAA